MPRFPLLFISGVTALWVVAIAILAVQNATAASVQLLMFTSVPIPLGTLMAFAAALGLLTGANRHCHHRQITPILQNAPNPILNNYDGYCHWHHWR